MHKNGVVISNKQMVSGSCQDLCSLEPGGPKHALDGDLMRAAQIVFIVHHLAPIGSHCIKRRWCVHVASEVAAVASAFVVPVVIF